MKKCLTNFFLLLFVLIIVSLKILPQPGQLDPSFGQGGIVNSTIGLNEIGNRATSSALQSDGKIVLAGYVESINNSFLIARLNTDGTLDQTFGINGCVQTVTGSSSYAYAIKIQDDGKIITAGYVEDGQYTDLILVRYHSNGTPDNSFGDNGVVITDASTSMAFILSLDIQSDGKILACGRASNYLFVARYNTDGTLDSTFNTDGIYVFFHPSITSSIGYQVKYRADGSIFVAGSGYVISGQTWQFLLIELNSNGNLSDFRYIINFPHNDFARALVIQNDGKLLLAGYSTYLNSDWISMARFNPDLSLDATFGAGGFIIFQVGGSRAHSVLQQSDGKLVVGGYRLISNNVNYFVARYNSDGSADSSFGTNGYVINNIGLIDTETPTPFSLLIQYDQRLVLSAYAWNGNNNRMASVRYNPNGTLDNSFGNGGVTQILFGTSTSSASASAIQPDGKIIAAGYSKSNNNDEFALARYNNDGTLDNTFGTNGTVITSVSPSDDRIHSIAIQSDGKIVAAGYSSGKFAMARYNANGTLDNSFGTNGIVLNTIATTSSANSVIIQSDGKILAAGYALNGVTDDFVIVRYNVNGTLDNSFGTNGIVFTPIEWTDIINAIALQQDGKIVAVGTTLNFVDGFRFAIARYNSNGTLDNSFGISGITITNIGSLNEELSSVFVQSDGKIVAGGKALIGGINHFGLIRLNSNGTLDNTFGNNGKVSTLIGTGARINSIGHQSDGKILAAGEAEFNNNWDFAIARYNSDGTLDNTFGNNGITTTAIGVLQDYASSMSVQTDGKILLAGTSMRASSNYVFMLARYFADDGAPATFQLSVNILNGWNMVSIPGLHPDNQHINTWWAGRDPAGGVFKYSGGYSPVTEAEPGTGYWMKHIGANIYNTGDEWPAGGILVVPNSPLNGTAGWNLIGGFHFSVPTSAITTNPQGLISGPVYKYSGGYQQAETLDPGYGYWIKLTASGQIILPDVITKATQHVKYFKESWGKIIITDAAGTSFTLYAVNDQVDLNYYELPPSPPAGIFDVRYTSNRIAEDISSDAQLIQMSGIEYPVTVRIENINISLADGSGKTISSQLKSGEQITITDNSIHKLKVISTDILKPTEYSLEQNYPNPFNPNTVIRYQLPVSGNVTLKVYDVLGGEVAALVNELQQPGTYEVQFDGSHLSSGMYLYRLESGSFIQTRKMIFIK